MNKKVICDINLVAVTVTSYNELSNLTIPTDTISILVMNIK